MISLLGEILVIHKRFINCQRHFWVIVAPSGLATLVATTLCFARDAAMSFVLVRNWHIFNLPINLYLLQTSSPPR
ncbi:hypothetical protein BKA70DRAFT_1445295 [Coprinopsis sp. MPI-PUGE-AT-0042]|nr:hypothetical protein BKA70DRAFT_1449369 [Coprinopsis sp. MPI-PUGE-AT-0042]KAH6885072.1 hypothetical protein BKA70DRAFT_1445295 [Coprinopsis sp. MPI-PUGE-AT-0042]